LEFLEFPLILKSSYVQAMNTVSDFVIERLRQWDMIGGALLAIQ
jgi:hypothetical protein